MQTFLYNLNTKQREGIIREGRYLVDGQPGILPDFLVELVIEKRPDPSYDYATQTLEYRSFADLENLKWIEESYVRDLTPEEIEQRKPGIPDVCTPRQFRLALIENNFTMEQIDNIIDTIPDTIKREKVRAEWEYALEINRKHPYIIEFGNLLNLSEKQVDDLFILANTL